MEKWDLYDWDRCKTGETHRRGEAVPAGRGHLVIHVALFNEAGQMLIQQRQPFKEGWPNMWDITAGGSALAGDTSRTAAEREVLEELGLRLDLSAERPKLTVNFDCGFDDIYALVREVDINALTLQESEVQAVRWADEKEIHRMIDEGSFIPYHKALITLLFHLRSRQGCHTR